MGREQLWRTIGQVHEVDPTFVSVTYGAGGATADRLARTMAVTDRILDETDIATVAHLTCVGATRDELADIVDRYAASGIANVLALRGDPPDGPGAPWQSHQDGLDYAVQLVEMIRERGEFCVGVAAFPYRHPASPDVEHDAKVLALKAKAGATFAITQLFFEADPYLELVDRAASYGCDIPIIPGLMPVTSLAQIDRFASLSGTPVPAPLVEALSRGGDDPKEVRRIGIEASTELADRLLQAGAPGLHFYTLNRSTATLEIYRALGLSPDDVVSGV